MVRMLVLRRIVLAPRSAVAVVPAGLALALAGVLVAVALALIVAWIAAQGATGAGLELAPMRWPARPNASG